MLDAAGAAEEARVGGHPVDQAPPHGGVVLWCYIVLVWYMWANRIVSEGENK